MALMHSQYTGPLPPTIWDVLSEAWEHGGISLQSDFARSNSTEVALAASCGFLSTIDPEGKTYRGKWRLTPAGLTALQHRELIC